MKYSNHMAVWLPLPPSLGWSTLTTWQPGWPYLSSMKYSSHMKSLIVSSYISRVKYVSMVASTYLSRLKYSSHMAAWLPKPACIIWFHNSLAFSMFWQNLACQKKMLKNISDIHYIHIHDHSNILANNYVSHHAKISDPEDSDVILTDSYWLW